MWTLSFLCRKVYNYKFNLKNRYRAFKFHNIYPWSVSPQCSSFLCVDPDFYLILLSFRFPLIFLVIQASRLWTPSAFMFEKAFILPLFLNDIEFSVDRVFFHYFKGVVPLFSGLLVFQQEICFQSYSFLFSKFSVKVLSLSLGWNNMIMMCFGRVFFHIFFVLGVCGTFGSIVFFKLWKKKLAIVSSHNFCHLLSPFFQGLKLHVYLTTWSCPIALLVIT